MNSTQSIIVSYPDEKIYKPKPKRLLSHISKSVLCKKDSFLKCPFSPSEELKDMKNSNLTKNELLFKSCNIDDIEKDFSCLKEERKKMNCKEENSYLRDSTKPNSIDEEQIFEIERLQNPFYKNFEY